MCSPESSALNLESTIDCAKQLYLGTKQNNELVARFFAQ
ncbi:hypothetical protein VIBNIAM115_560039 [Vibrio nigripulchritudo AM115]|nr:hypothetical protein VIBNIAM115_560039 [Vibrio nigripulchritudo AM115]